MALCKKKYEWNTPELNKDMIAAAGNICLVLNSIITKKKKSNGFVFWKKKKYNKQMLKY